MARSEFRFSYPKRVRYSEIDAQAVVFNARFLDYLDIAIAEYWRAIGLKSSGPGGLEFHVAHIAIDYKAPVRLDEQIDLCLRVLRIGSSSISSAFEFHGKDQDDLRAAGEIVSVRVAEARGRPAAIPDEVVALFETYEGRRLRS